LDLWQSGAIAGLMAAMRKVQVVGVGLAMLVLGGCDKAAADTASPQPAAAPTEASSPNADGDIDYAYASNEEEAGEQEAAPEAAEPEIDPDALRAIAKEKASEVVDRYSPMIMTPALPLSWPSEEKKIQYVVYPLMPQQDGLTEFKVGKPVRVILDLADNSTTLEELTASKVLKKAEDKHERITGHERVAHAEQTLIRLVSGDTDVSHSVGDLDGYKEWFAAHPKVEKDLKGRMPQVLELVEHPEKAVPADAK